MDVYSDIKNKLQKICQPKGLRLYFAEIVSIQDDTTCTVKLEDDLQLSDVRLRSVVNSEESGIVITPTVGSVVLVADLSGGKLSSMAVIMYSEIDKIEINGGKNGGLINIEDLVSHINTIEDDINNLKTAMSGWTPTPQDGGAALKGAVTSWAGQSITKTKKSDIEDDKIKH